MPVSIIACLAAILAPVSPEAHDLFDRLVPPGARLANLRTLPTSAGRVLRADHVSRLTGAGSLVAAHAS